MTSPQRLILNVLMPLLLVNAILWQVYTQQTLVAAGWVLAMVGSVWLTNWSQA